MNTGNTPEYQTRRKGEYMEPNILGYYIFCASIGKWFTGQGTHFDTFSNAEEYATHEQAEEKMRELEKQMKDDTFYVMAAS